MKPRAKTTFVFASWKEEQRPVTTQSHQNLVDKRKKNDIIEILEIVANSASKKMGLSTSNSIGKVKRAFRNILQNVNEETSRKILFGLTVNFFSLPKKSLFALLKNHCFDC